MTDEQQRMYRPDAAFSDLFKRVRKLEETVAALQPSEPQSVKPGVLKDLLTVPELAKVLRVAESTAWRMIKDREIESIVVGGRSRRVERRVLDAYLASRRGQSGGEVR